MRRPKSTVPVFSHLDQGAAHMVDVSEKPVTVREASASARVTMKAEVLRALYHGDLPKGDALATSRTAGVLAAKRTAELIPMCHPLPLDWVDVTFAKRSARVLEIQCTARTAARTGVEMEALTGAAIAALTIYDMAKSADKRMILGPIRLERKTGGKSGSFNVETSKSQKVKKSKR